MSEEKSGRTFPVNGVAFTMRERKLIGNCIIYASNQPAGLPGHTLMVIIAKLANAYPVVTDIDDAVWNFDIS